MLLELDHDLLFCADERETTSVPTFYFVKKDCVKMISEYRCQVARIGCSDNHGSPKNDNSGHDYDSDGYRDD